MLCGVIFIVDFLNMSLEMKNFASGFSSLALLGKILHQSTDITDHGSLHARPLANVKSVHAYLMLKERKPNKRNWCYYFKIIATTSQAAYIR